MRPHSTHRAAPASCWRCCWRRSPPPSPRRCSPTSSAGAARSSIAATRCRRRRSRWPACSGRGRSSTTMRSARRSTICGEPWAMTLPPIPLDNGQIRGAIVDAQARLNVNALGGTGDRADIERARIARLFAQRGGPTAALMRSPTGSIATASCATAAPRTRTTRRSRRPGLPRTRRRCASRSLRDVKGVTPPALAAVAPVPGRAPGGHAAQRQHGAAGSAAAVVDKLSGERWPSSSPARAQKPFTTVAEFRARLPRGDARGRRRRSREERFLLRNSRGPARSDHRACPRTRATHDADWPDVVWQVVE